MPSDDFFGFSVLVAGRPIPEYAKDGRVYVESNLYTPFSYYHKTEQLVNGELEIESVPVTPYQLQIRLAPHCEDSAVFVYVDGVLASKFMLEQAQSKWVFYLLFSPNHHSYSLYNSPMPLPMFTLYVYLPSPQDHNWIQR